jgi:cysteine desulfurase
MKEIIYMDNAATTAVSNDVLSAMIPFFADNFGNASSVHQVGRNAKKALEQAREMIATCLNARPSEIYFTSGGSEANNWAIKSAAHLGFAKGKNHIITSKIEHHSVLHCVQRLAKAGFDTTYLDVDENGMVDPEDVRLAIKDTTSLVSIMFANNEIGTIEPIFEIGKICREKNVLFHTDAVQAIGNVPIKSVEDLNVDLMSISAHKFHGPKGVGVLYIKTGTKLSNFIDGGAQEKGLRGGTENVCGIVGMAAAMKVACTNVEDKIKTMSEIRDKIIHELLKIKSSRLNGDKIHRLPGNINMCFGGIEGESLLLLLDARGICASSGSACTSGSLDPSHVLLAIGLPHEVAHGSLRISLGVENTMEEAEYLLEVLPPIIQRLRDMSPIWCAQKISS